jgi:hypothetical protein
MLGVWTFAEAIGAHGKVTGIKVSCLGIILQKTLYLVR